MDKQIIPVRHPHGYIIGRQTNPPFWEFWNRGNKWAGSGYLFKTEEQARKQLDKNK